MALGLEEAFGWLVGGRWWRSRWWGSGGDEGAAGAGQQWTYGWAAEVAGASTANVLSWEWLRRRRQIRRW